jgi:hypothetical protein
MGNALMIPFNAPSYQSLSTDLVNGKVPNASYKGANIFFTDVGAWYRVLDDLTLVPLTGESSSGSSKMIRAELEFINSAGSSTAYTIGDIVSAGSTIVHPYELTNAFNKAGGSGFIFGLAISCNKSSLTPAFRVHFYNSNAATVAIDNAPFMDNYSDQAYKLRSFDLPAMLSSTNTSGSCSRTFDTSTIRHPIVASASSTSLFFSLETLTAFTSASASLNYTVSAMISPD